MLTTKVYTLLHHLGEF